MTRATEPVAAEIMAGRPPTTAIVTAMVNEANSPALGSTPAMMENEIASGINARATTSPASTSVFNRGRDLRAASADVPGSPAWRACGVDITCLFAKVIHSVGAQPHTTDSLEMEKLHASLRGAILRDRIGKNKNRSRPRPSFYATVDADKSLHFVTEVTSGVLRAQLATDMWSHYSYRKSPRRSHIGNRKPRKKIRGLPPLRRFATVLRPPDYFAAPVDNV